MTVGQIVKYHRQKAGLTQFDLGCEVGLAKNVISNIERDVPTVGVNAYQKVADFFKLGLVIAVMPTEQEPVNK